MHAIALVLFLAAAAAVQSEASLSVTGHVSQPQTLKAADLAKLPRAKVAGYEGVWLHEILTKAGFAPGAEQAGYVIASASDGYRAVFSLAEVDPTVTDPQVLVADKVNGEPLTGRDGTFRIVATKDIRGVRGVRQLARLEVVLLTPPGK
jgi:DMSO/TMAO reductase YedYZ molybdopterin-dependent catalytic subunit